MSEDMKMQVQPNTRSTSMTPEFAEAKAALEKVIIPPVPDSLVESVVNVHFTSKLDIQTIVTTIARRAEEKRVANVGG